MAEEQNKDIEELLLRMEKTGLIKKEHGKPKLDLGIFNNNLEKASTNLGLIIPNIIEVSKEQVALINHGLEGVINFMRAFQTVNTSFALMAENPNEISLFVNKFNEIRKLEEHIVTDIKETLQNFSVMLYETFKESGIYYTALAQIIYSEETEGTIKVKYKRKEGKLSQQMREIYKRELPEVKQELEKSLGLVQLIESLNGVTGKIKKMDLSDTSLEYYQIKSTKGEKIKLDAAVLRSLKSVSGDLLSALMSVGYLFKDENNQLQTMRAREFRQKIAADYGLEAIKESLSSLKKDESVVDFFISKMSAVINLQKLSVESRDKAALYREIKAHEKETEEAKKVHDEIVVRQVEFINRVVSSFISIVSLWADQVDNEIHVGQVADKAVIALRKLTEVELRLDKEIGTESLLLTAKTQEEINKTCVTAKGLKNVGRVMQFLLKRVKDLVNFNQGIEKNIRAIRSDARKAKEYKAEKLSKIKEVIYERYPNMSKKVVNIIENFGKHLNKISNDKNLYQNMHIIEEFSDHYNKIDEAFNKFLTDIKVKKKSVNVENFAQYCEGMGLTMEMLDNSVDALFDQFNKLSKSFRDDFDNYMKISDAYRSFVKELSPMLDLMEYIIASQKRLAKEEIDVKSLNYTIQAYQLLFNDLKKNQREQAKLDEDLRKVMKSVGLTKSSLYYKQKYFERMDEELKKLYDELEKYVQRYFSDRERMKQAYNQVGKWVNQFDVDFSEYNKKLKSMKVGFFQKLFKTQSYKKSEFWKDLKEIKSSFVKYDEMVKKLGRINLQRATNVKSFCENSVKLVNDILNGYKALVNELYDVVSTMHLVVENLKNLTSEGYLNTFEEMLAAFKKLNENIDKTEKQVMDLEEFDKLDVSGMMTALRDVTNFDELEKVTFKQKTSLEKYKNHINVNVDKVRKGLISFFLNYLVNVYPENSAKGKEYRLKINQLKKAKA